MGLVEFSYNVATHSATKESPFKVAYGVEPLQPVDLALKGAHSTLEFNHDSEDLAKKQKQMLEKTRLLLEKASRCLRSKSMLQDVKWNLRWGKRYC